MASNRDAVLYLQATDADAHAGVGEILLLLQGGKGRKNNRGMNENAEALSALAGSVNPYRGKKFFAGLLDFIRKAGAGETYLGIQGGGVRDLAGYWTITINFGSSGEAITKQLLLFFGKLMKSGHACAYMGIEDTDWFCRFARGRTTSKRYVPFEDRAKDDKTLASGVYAWWHTDLPDDIREGLLNLSNAEDIYREMAGEEPTEPESDDESLRKLPSPFREVCELLNKGDVKSVVDSVTATEIVGKPVETFVPGNLKGAGYEYGVEDPESTGGFNFGVSVFQGGGSYFLCNIVNLEGNAPFDLPAIQDIEDHIRRAGLEALAVKAAEYSCSWSWRVGDNTVSIFREDLKDEGASSLCIEAYWDPQ